MISNPGELDAFLRKGGKEAALRKLAELSEKERKALGPSLEKLWAEVSHITETREDVTAVYLDNLRTAILFCCEFPSIKKLGNNALLNPSETLFILSERKPKWLAKWCDFALKLAPEWYTQTVVSLQKLRLVQIKPTPYYYEQLALFLTGVENLPEEIISIPGLLDEFYNFLEEPLVIRAIGQPGDVLRQRAIKFVRSSDFRNSINISDGNNPPQFRHFPSINSLLLTRLQTNPLHEGINIDGYDLWIDAINILVDKDLLDRSRLLKQSFLLLHQVGETPRKKIPAWSTERSLAVFATKWNDKLCPAKASYIDQFLPLAGAINANVAWYALCTLLAVEISAIDADELCIYLSATLRQKDKDNAMAALQLLERCWQHRRDYKKENSALDVKLVSAFIEAFNNKNKSVHQRVLKYIADSNTLRSVLNSDAKLRAKVESLTTNLEGTNRVAAKALLTTPTISAAQKTSHDDAGLDKARMVSLINAATQAITSEFAFEQYLDWVKLPSVESMTEHEAAAFATQPIKLDRANMPVLHTTDKLVPINSVEEILFLASAALTAKQPMIKLELLLDAIAQIRPDKTSDFIEKAQGINRLLLDSLSHYRGVMTSALGLVLYVWLNEELPEFVSLNSFPFEARCAGLVVRLREGLSLPMLATPTHAGGWIDAHALVERVKKYQARGRLLTSETGHKLLSSPKQRAWFADKANNIFYADALEFNQALLRLAPDDRASVFKEAQDVAGDCGLALRYVLSEETQKSVGDNDLRNCQSKSFALAAFRSRHPYEVCPLRFNEVAEREPDVVVPSTYTYDRDAVENWDNDRYKILHRNLPEALRAAPQPKPVKVEDFRPDYYDRHNNDTELSKLHWFEDYPSVNVHSRVLDWQPFEEPNYMWLQNCEPMLARMCKRLVANLNSIVSTWRDDYSLLLNPDFDMSKNGSWWTVFAFTAKNDEIRQFGLDALVAAVYELRADPHKIGHCLAQLYKFSPGRVANCLRELSRISALHSLFVWQILQAYLKEKGTKVELNFFEIMLEMSEEHKFIITPENRTTLKSLAGSGKPTTKIEKLALRLDNSPECWISTTELNDALAVSIKARLDRIDRWRNSQYFEYKAPAELS